MTALFGRVVGFFSRDLLFASLLPLLMLTAGLSATLAGIVGLDAVWAWLTSLSARRLAALTGVGGLIVTALAYLLTGFRPSLLDFWSGSTRLFPPPGTRGFALAIQRHRWSAFNRISLRESTWAAVRDDFNEKIDGALRTRGGSPGPVATAGLKVRVCAMLWAAGRSDPSSRIAAFVKASRQYSVSAQQPILRGVRARDPELAVRLEGELLRAAEDKGPPLSPEQRRRVASLRDEITEIVQDLNVAKASDDAPSPRFTELRDDLLMYFANYSYSGLLREVHGEVSEVLNVRWDDVKAYIDAAAADRDEQFPFRSMPRATALGNVVAAYNGYPLSRYRIGTKFWSRLLAVVRPDLVRRLEDQQTLLDFSLAMTTFSAVYALAVLWGGPAVWTDWPAAAIVLASLSLLGFLICYGFYRMSVEAARQLGGLVRSSYDLSRLDLLHALWQPHPQTLQEERATWNQVSQLAYYGDTDVAPETFVLRPREREAKATDAPPPKTPDAMPPS